MKKQYPIRVKDWTTNHGLPARVVQHPTMLHLCGYVGVDKNSDLYGVEYVNIHDYVFVHGGVTFTGTLEDSDLWWIGYDCAHQMDFSKANPSGFRRDPSYCVEECESLAKQVVGLEFLWKAKKEGKLEESKHNFMLGWYLQEPENYIVQEYFKIIKN